MRHQYISANQGKRPHLQDVPFPELDCPKNVPEAFIPLEVCHVNPEDPIAIRSCLSFAVLGRTGDNPKRQNYDIHHIHAAADDISLNDQVELFWKSESLGTKEHYKSVSMEDRRAERIISDTIAKVDGHYCVGLWRQAKPKFPFDHQMSEIRLRHLKYRL